MKPFIDTHAHLIHGVDWALMDEIASSGLLEQAWLMHCPCASDGIPFADEEEVVMCARRYPGMYIPFGNRPRRPPARWRVARDRRATKAPVARA